MLKAVGLDLDNTLYDQDQFEIPAFRKISKIVSFEYNISESVYFQNLVKLYKIGEKNKIFDKAFQMIKKLPQDWENFITSEILPIYRNNKPMLSLYDGAREFIEYLKSKGLILVLITNGNVNIQNYKIDALEIRECFNKIYISDEYNPPARKPDIRMFEDFLKDFSLKGCECVYIGDHETDSASEKVGILYLNYKQEASFFEIKNHLKKYIDSETFKL